MLSLALIFAAPFAAFVFISEQFNPFTKPISIPLRYRWHLARRIAVVILLGTIANFIFNTLLLWPMLDSALISAALALPAITIIFVLSYRDKYKYE